MWDWGEGGVPHNFYYSFFYLIFCFKKIKHFSHHHYYYFTLQGFIYFFPILILLLFILYFVWYSTQHHHLPFPLTVFLNASHKNMWKHKKYNFSASFFVVFSICIDFLYAFISLLLHLLFFIILSSYYIIIIRYFFTIKRGEDYFMYFLYMWIIQLL